MIRKRLLQCTLLICSLLPARASSENVNNDAGTSGFGFMQLGYDARGVAMGGAAAAVPNGLCGVLHNPAALAGIERRQIMVGYRPIILDIRGTPLAFGMRIRDRKSGTDFGVAALSMVYMSYGTLVSSTDASGLPTGETWGQFSAGAGLSWAREVWEHLLVGVTARALYDRIYGPGSQYTASGMAFDLGAQYHLLKSRFICGIVLRNLGFTLQGYSDATDDMPLPLNAIIGFSYNPRYIPNVLLAVDFDKARDDFLNCRTGLEVDVFREILFARVGYALSTQDVREGFRLISLGGDEQYQKTDWSSVRFGFGIKAPIRQVSAAIDAAYEIRVEKVNPTFALSALVEF